MKYTDYCQCGCGQKTNIAMQDRPIFQQAKGEPLRFIRGHNAKTKNWKEDDRFLLDGKPAYRVFVERALGKELPSGATVHHHTDGSLVLCENKAYHNHLHKRQRAYKTCGHADWLKCRYCMQYDAPENLDVYGYSVSHTKCRKGLRNEYYKNYYLRNGVKK